MLGYWQTMFTSVTMLNPQSSQRKRARVTEIAVEKERENVSFACAQGAPIVLNGEESF